MSKPTSFILSNLVISWCLYIFGMCYKCSTPGPKPFVNTTSYLTCSLLIHIFEKNSNKLYLGEYDFTTLKSSLLEHMCMIGLWSFMLHTCMSWPPSPPHRTCQSILTSSPRSTTSQLHLKLCMLACCTSCSWPLFPSSRVFLSS